MVRGWLRRLILWALQAEDCPAPVLGTPLGAGSTPLFDEWLHGAAGSGEDDG